MRRVVTALTVVLLLLTGTQFWLTQTAHQDARDAAHALLPGVLDATDEGLSSLLSDSATALADWSPGVLPDGFSSAQVVSGTPEPWLQEAAPGRLVGVDRSALALALIESETRFRRGTVPLKELERRLRADPRAGAPAGSPPSRTSLAAYSRIELLNDQGVPLWALATVDERASEAERMALASMMSGKTRPRSRKSVAEGRESGRLPLEYKDTEENKAAGLWRRSAALPGVWIVAEVREEAALAAVSGVPLEVRGFRLGTLYGWHGTLALAVLCLLVAVFLALQRRDVRYSTLIRVFAFVRPYAWGAVGVVLLGLLFTWSNAFSKIFVLKSLIDDVLIPQPEDALDRLIWLGCALMALAVLTAGAAYLREYLHNYYATAILADIRLAIGRKIVSLPLSYFHRMRAGDLVARIERDAGLMRKVFNLAFKTGAVEPFQLVAMVVAAFVVNPRLALVLVGMPIVVYPLFRIARKIRARSQKRQILLADISHVIFQMLIGIKVVKAFGGEEREAERLDDANQRFVRQARRIHRLSAASDGLVDLLTMSGGAIVMVAGGVFVLSGEVTVGDVTTFVVMIQQIYRSAKALTRTANQIVDAAPGVERVFEVLDAQSELVDGPLELPRKSLEQGIRYEQVEFAYDDKPVLLDVDLEIPAGQVVALVGPTGAGKTTLCDLIARFYDPTSGRITYDGVDIREYSLRSLLRSVAIVTQDAFLFNGTIEDNIRYGRPEATREEVRRAAADAFVHDEIVAMEGGYQKLAGERGTSVSGGQRQRITIARAILKDAPILILDEATSALDSHAEQQVQAALEKLMRGRTVIVVAHRLSTIRDADKVVVLRRGRVVEEGAPSDLLVRPESVFREMYERQMGGASGPADADEEAA